MYLLSMAFFAVIVLILSLPSEIQLGNYWEFVVWDKIWDWLWWFPLIFVLILVVDIIAYCYLRSFVLKGTQHISCEIEQVESLQGDILAFLASYFIPLVSFCLEKTMHKIVLLILFVAIGRFYVNGNLFYQNPTLSLLGFKTYNVRCRFTEKGDAKERKVLCLTNLAAGDKIKYIPLSKNVWYAVKVKSGNR